MDGNTIVYYLADGDLYQLMANYSYNDKNSVTFRYSNMDTQITVIGDDSSTMILKQINGR